MNFIKISSENLDTEHICCAISSKKDPQVVAKKNWLKERLAEGLVFLKGDMRGKCFIEYIPAENAWAPLTAKGYMLSLIHISMISRTSSLSASTVWQCRPEVRFLRGLDSPLLIPSTKSLTSVSYTHLDVYKRQAMT